MLPAVLLGGCEMLNAGLAGGSGAGMPHGEPSAGMPWSQGVHGLPKGAPVQLQQGGIAVAWMPWSHGVHGMLAVRWSPVHQALVAKMN